MHSRNGPGGQPRRRWASQVPRPSSRYAPSALTPGDRTTAHACGFVVRAGFTLSGRLAIPDIHIEAGIGSRLRITARIVRLPRLRRVGYPITTPGRLHVHRQLHGRSFQSTRSVRLVLTHQRAQRKTGLSSVPSVPSVLRGHFTAPLLIAVKSANSGGWRNQSSPTACGPSSNRCSLPTLPSLVAVGLGVMIARL